MLQLLTLRQPATRRPPAHASCCRQPGPHLLNPLRLRDHQHLLASCNTSSLPGSARHALSWHTSAAAPGWPFPCGPLQRPCRYPNIRGSSYLMAVIQHPCEYAGRVVTLVGLRYVQQALAAGWHAHSTCLMPVPRLPTKHRCKCRSVDSSCPLPLNIPLRCPLQMGSLTVTM